MPETDSAVLRRFISAPSFDPAIVLQQDASQPRISIVIPSYNQLAFIEQTILSVLNQNYANTELIVVDGGSTDGSQDVIRRYERYIARWVSEADRGQLDAIRKGVAMATGAVVGYQNSDDLYLPNAFERVARAHTEGADLIYGNTMIIDNKNVVIRKFRNTPARLPCLFYSAAHIPSQAAFWGRAINQRLVLELEGAVIDKIHFGMERFIFGLVLALARTPVFLRETLGCFRIHNSSKTFRETGAELNQASKRAEEENKFIVEDFVRRGYIRPFSLTRMLYCWARRFAYLLAQGDIGQIRSLVGKAYLVRHLRSHYS